MATKTELQEQLANTLSDLTDVKSRHRRECEPYEAKIHEIKKQLGPIYAGFEVGDIMAKKPDRFNRVTQVRVTSISATFHGNYSAHGIVIKKDGTDGQVRELHHWDDWKKI